MSLQLEIPEGITRAIRLPEGRMKQELLIELSIALYSQGFLSFGKARELAGAPNYEFGLLLGKRGIARHYGQEELDEDIAYACGE